MTPAALLLAPDGVLRTWSTHRAETADLERAHGLPAGTVAALATAPDRLAPALVGEIPDEAWRLGIARALVPLVGDRAAELVAAWSESPGEVDHAVLDLLRGVRRRGAPVVLVGNATTRLEFDLVRLDLHEEVDAVVSSARLGAAKPDGRIYAAAAAAAGVPPGRCLYIDEDEDGVRAALAAGLRAERYVGVRDLRARLVSAGLLAA